MPNIVGSLIGNQFDEESGKTAYESISTFGFDQYNMPLIDEKTGKPYRIFEHPFLRFYVGNLTNRFAESLSAEMGKEYPVPLPSEVENSEQQKHFQVKTEDELKRVQEQFAAAANVRFAQLDYEIKMERVMTRRKEIQEKIKRWNNGKNYISQHFQILYLRITCGNVHESDTNYWHFFQN